MGASSAFPHNVAGEPGTGGFSITGVRSPRTWILLSTATSAGGSAVADGDSQGSVLARYEPSRPPGLGSNRGGGRVPAAVAAGCKNTAPLGLALAADGYSQGARSVADLPEGVKAASPLTAPE